MAGTILFPREPHWIAGLHGYYPIVNRTRAAVSEDEKRLVEPLFETIEQGGLDIIALDEDVSPEAFNAFYRATKREYGRCLASEAEARMPEGFYAGIMAAWAQLIEILEADSRCRVESGPSA
jgi:hypothetical protein